MINSEIAQENRVPSKKQSSHIVSVTGVALGITCAVYGVRVWRQIGILNQSLRRQRVFDDDFNGRQLGRYYYSFFPSYLQPETEPPEVDEGGIPVSDYDRHVLIRGVSGRHYNPLTVAHWVLGAYDDYLTNNERQHLDLALRRADWLVQNQHVIADGAGLWYHTADWGITKGPWPSAMAQGFALSGLCRAYQESSDSKYMDTARRALKAFDIPVTQGGLYASDEKGNIFYEEMARQPIHILNGHIFALFGLHDYYRFTHDEHARQLFKAGANAVQNRLPDYDLGFWSRYSLDKPDWYNHWTIAAPIYQQVHIDQLRFLYKITNNDVFARYADRWEMQQKHPLVSTLLKIAFVAFKDMVLFSKRARTTWKHALAYLQNGQ